MIDTVITNREYKRLQERPACERLIENTENPDDDKDDIYMRGARAFWWLCWLILMVTGCTCCCRGHFKNKKLREDIHIAKRKLQIKVRGMYSEDYAKGNIVHGASLSAGIPMGTPE